MARVPSQPMRYTYLGPSGPPLVLVGRGIIRRAGTAKILQNRFNLGPQGHPLAFVSRSIMRRTGGCRVVGASSGSCPKEHHEDGRNSPKDCKVYIFRAIWRPGPSQPMAPSRWGPDLVRDPFPRPSLSPGNLQTRPTGPTIPVNPPERPNCTAET